MFYIYLIHNVLTNKVYVGLSKDVQRRWEKHIKIARQKRTKEKFYIHKAIQKYGERNFIFSVIQKFNKMEHATEAEKYWVSFYQSKDHEFGYNLTDGGEGRFGCKMSDEAKRKIAEKATGRKHTEETKKKISEIVRKRYELNPPQKKTEPSPMKGIPLSAEHREKLSSLGGLRSKCCLSIISKT